MTNYLLQQIKDKQNKDQHINSIKTERHPMFKIMEQEFALPSMKNEQKYDEFMGHIRQLLDRNKVKSQNNINPLRIPNNFILNKSTKQGSRKKLFETKVNDEQYQQKQVQNQQILSDPSDTQTQRVLQYQQRIGLVRKHDKTEIQLRQIAQKHNIKW
ncbi:unnamed protein product [Paramecium sonneborni]|uniref:Uncharacterized protein n=1 Tax=Paramecium sonneborni TaxID=65129 RepID=A0A8S1PUC2_9CILI|nr:unnamed protein product [Paramecium sonneborni]